MTSHNEHDNNHDNLHGHDAIKKIKDVVNEAESCFFCTAVAVGDSSGARPMAVRKVDDDGNLWFLSPVDSHKNDELKLDSRVRLYFQAPSHSYFLELNGHATISQDRAKIEELWEPILKTWFTEGKDDPRISVIKVIPSDGYYWNSKHGNIIGGVKMLVGAAIGKKLDDAVEGAIDL
ncbi:MAG: general stress protein [Cellvibrio sp. 79]|nr:MAG: general stress protein [Cellvibrio sp. 79]